MVDIEKIILLLGDFSELRYFSQEELKKLLDLTVGHAKYDCVIDAIFSQNLLFYITQLEPRKKKKDHTFSYLLRVGKIYEEEYKALLGYNSC